MGSYTGDVSTASSSAIGSTYMRGARYWYVDRVLLTRQIGCNICLCFYYKIIYTKYKHFEYTTNNQFVSSTPIITKSRDTSQCGTIGRKRRKNVRIFKH